MLLAVLILGPALAPGLVIAYDMVWSPTPRWTPFVLGMGTPAPRVVPSDAAIVLLGKLITAEAAQKVVLVLVLVLAGTGAAALLRHLRPDASILAVLAAVVAALWNPFVAERLVVGQWTILLGYAVLPWLTRAVLLVRVRAASIWTVCGWLTLAAVGGANSLIIALAALVVLLGSPVTPRLKVFASLVWLGGAAVWAVPALAGSARMTVDGVAEFIPRSDTPFGVVLSLASGGGFWNTAVHPPERSGWFIALLATSLSLVAISIAVRHFWVRGPRALVVVAIGAFLLTVSSTLQATSGLWSALITEVPGGGLLRDSQKLLAPWVLLIALGLGLLVDAARTSSRMHSWAGPTAVVLTVLPLLILPSLAWGGSGRLRAVEVPAGYRQVAHVVSGLPSGEVGLLPWNQYRRYDWNGSRVSLTLAPRIIDQRILFNDSLPLSVGEVPGEDPRAARVSRRIKEGTDPIVALRDEGVTYLAIEVGTGLPDDIPTDAGQIVAESEHLVIIAVGEPEEVAQSHRWHITGWAVSLVTWVVVLLGLAISRVPRKGRRL
ncbi:MAG TPA: hypothetical protein GXZ60_12825 [Intrasporangiaceae bacterium]|nr:hypothetical protein [Intrasporangiaceae bacterium]